jgi:hypothetical protein
MRTALLLACLLLAPALAAKEPAPQAVQFIDRSNILFPEVIEGHFKVKSHDQDPGVFGGVTIKFEKPAVVPSPSFTLTAYVYPVGRMTTEAALAAGISHIVDGVKGQDYTDVRVEADTPYAVAAPTAPLLAKTPRGNQKIVSPSHEPPAKPDPTDEDMAAALKSWTPEDRTPGRRVMMHFSNDGTPVRSVGYVFYRQMMLVKLRITAAAADIDEDTFSLHANLAANSIAPAFEIQNFGTCGVLQLPLLPEGESDKSEGNAGALALIEEMGRVQRENCVVDEGEPDALPAGRVRHTLVYPADTWK